MFRVWNITYKQLSSYFLLSININSFVVENPHYTNTVTLDLSLLLTLNKQKTHMRFPGSGSGHVTDRSTITTYRRRNPAALPRTHRRVPDRIKRIKQLFSIMFRVWNITYKQLSSYFLLSININSFVVENPHYTNIVRLDLSLLLTLNKQKTHMWFPGSGSGHVTDHSTITTYRRRNPAALPRTHHLKHISNIILFTI
jgi:predicted membrane protein